LSYTLILSPLAAAACALLSLPASWVFVRIKSSRPVLFLCIIFLLSVPAPVAAIGIVKLLNHPGILGKLYDSGGVIVIGYVVRFLPFAVLVNIVGIRSIPVELEERATLDGAGWMQKLVYVVTPLNFKAILISFFLVFILSVGEIGSTLIICPPGVTPLSIRFFTLIHYGMRAETAAICLILVFVVILPALVLTMLLWRFFGRKLG